MQADLTPYQFERIIQLLEKEFNNTDSSFYCGLRNKLKEQYQNEIARINKLLDKELLGSRN